MNTNSNRTWFCLVLSATLAISGCSGGGDEQPTNAEPASEAMPALETQLANDSRSADDRGRDSGRRPAAVLDFLGVEPGMSVVDIMAAGGYYTEVLSLAVGPDGNVTAQNPAMMMEVRDGMFAKQLGDRLADDRLSNVSRLDKEMTDLSAADGPFDVAITALNLHDIYNRFGEEAAVGMMQMVYSTLKPGGVFGVIDHDGTTENDNVALHRMQKADAIRVAEAAGFIVEGDSELLHSDADDMSQVVFAEGLRGNTNRFLLKLRKPEA